MKILRPTLIAIGFGALAVLSRASAYPDVTLDKGTEVMLRFEQPLSSKTAKVGQSVRFRVAKAVEVDGVTVLKANTPVTGVIERVDPKGRFGKNARMRIVLNPVKVNGAQVLLEPRDKGKPLSGSRTDQAAAASGAGALVLGPLGLLGGAFVTGKSVNIKKGDTLRTEVSKTVALTVSGDR